MSSYGKYVVCDTLNCDGDLNDFSDTPYDFKIPTAELLVDSSSGTGTVDIGTNRCGFVLITFPAAQQATVQLNSQLLPRQDYELKWNYCDADNSMPDAGPPVVNWTKTNVVCTQTTHTGGEKNAYVFNFSTTLASLQADDTSYIYFHIVRKQRK
jgi:hypothetical protein